MTKENRESVTIHPSSNFAGDFAMYQIIFLGSGFHPHMCLPAAAEKIENLLISVNEAGNWKHYLIIKENKQIANQRMKLILYIQ